MKKKSFAYAAFAAVASLALCAGAAKASGFALIEQSVTGLGNSFAGGAASAQDASTIFYNPAGMSLLTGQQAILGIHYIRPQAIFSNDGSTHAITGAPLNGPTGGDAGVGKVVPNLYYANNAGSFAWGLGVMVPFGLATKYDEDWVGRYHGVESDLQTVNFNPAVSFKSEGGLIFGLGASAQYLNAKLTSAVDYPLVAGKVVKTALSNPAYATNLAPGTRGNDVDMELNADGWAYGWNAGMMYEISPAARVGLSYRSDYKYSLEGDADFTDAPTFAAVIDTSAGNAVVPLSPAQIAGLNAAAQAAVADADAETSITMPGVASLSGFVKATDALDLMADLSWTHWSVFDELVVEMDNTLKSSTTTYDWEDTWRASLGASYHVNDYYVVRCGVAFDQSPVTDAEHRNVRVPDADRTWLSLGGGYNFGALTLDAGYAHLFVKSGDINKTLAEDAGRGKLVGSYDLAVDIVSVQATYAF